MNNGNIYINPEVLQSKITQLRTEKQNMQNALNKIKSDINGMIQYWSGTAGEEAYNILVEYTKDFKTIIDTIEKNIRFIENTLAAYNQMDKLINKKMEENANVEAF